MPTFEITTPSGTFEVDAPDEATALDALRKAGEMPEQQSAPNNYDQSWFAQTTSGLNEGIGSMLGTPVDLANSAIGAGMAGVNKAFGTNLQPSAKPFLGSAHINDMMGNVGAIRPQTNEMPKQMARRTMKSVGASMIPAAGMAAKAARPLAVGLGSLASAAGGGASAAVAQQVAPDNPYAEMGAELLGGLGTAAAVGGLQKAVANRAVKKAVPTQDNLKANAERLYDIADKKGVTATQADTQKLAADMRQIASDEGLISPTGRISEAYPKAREAIRMLDDYAQGDMSVKQMKSVRKTLSDAAQSVDGSESRIASMMLKKFDDFTEPLAPELKVARGYWHRWAKAKKLATLDELAESRAGQFSGSGYENARRTEYRALERDLIKGNETGYTPAETKAVSRVAQGTKPANAARYVGKAAPTGPVSFGASAGIPFYIGNAIGGPWLGAAASGATMGAGFIGREIATKLGAKNAELASLIVRNGGNLPLASLDKATLARVLAVLGTTQAATLPRGKRKQTSQ